MPAPRSCRRDTDSSRHPLSTRAPASVFLDSQLFHVGSWAADERKWKIYILDNCPVSLPWGRESKQQDLYTWVSFFFNQCYMGHFILRMFFLESLFASQSLLLRKSARPNVILTPSQPPRTVYAHPLSRPFGQYPIANIIADFCISARWKSPCSLNSTCITYFSLTVSLLSDKILFDWRTAKLFSIFF